ncbi:MAG: DUF5818 domain-containing protein [Candidatus Sulfotelmatobacter sp.]
MKNILLRFSMAAALTLLIVAIGRSSYAQQADQDPAPASRPEATTPQQQQNDVQTPQASDTMTHEATVFSGKITKEDGKLVLKDPVTKVSYKLDDQTQAKQYVGKSVKVSGKLDMNSNTIQVDSIEPLS